MEIREMHLLLLNLIVLFYCLPRLNFFVKRLRAMRSILTVKRVKPGERKEQLKIIKKRLTFYLVLQIEQITMN